MCARTPFIAALLGLLWAGSACMPAAGQRATSTSPGAASPGSGPATLADVSAACERVQNNLQVPVTCSTRYIDDVPALIVGFVDTAGAREWLEPFAEQVGNPFCDAASRNGREARVYMIVGTGSAQKGRVWSCELGKWSEWYASTRQPATRPPATVADAISACNAMQANSQVPVSCRTEYVNDIAAMIVGFPTEEAAKAHLGQVAERVAGPFCDAANRANRRASLIITLANARARHFECEQQRWGEWIDLPRASAVDRSSL